MILEHLFKYRVLLCKRDSENASEVAPSSKENLHGFSLNITLLLLAAASASAAQLEENTAADRLKELAASASVPLTTYLIPPSPPPSPAEREAVKSKSSDQKAEAALAMSIAFPLAAFLLLLFCVPLCCHRWTGGNTRSFLRLCTTHSNPNIILRYLPVDARERIRIQIAEDRAALGRQVRV